MRVSREQVAENRRAILDVASRMFREHGFEAVTVADIMKAAGLTHGGFYGYFKSKDELIAAALADALEKTLPPSGDLAAYAADYLSTSHRDARACGCVTAALAAETVRLPGDARTEMTASLRRQIERLSRVAPGEDDGQRRRAAIGSWAAMVGAMILARVSDDAALSGEVLDTTRAWLGEQDRVAAPRRARNGAVRPRRAAGE